MKYRLNYSMGFDEWTDCHEKDKGLIKTCPL